MKYSIHRFFILTVLSVSAWVFASLYFGQAFFSLFKGQWIWALLFFLVILSVLKKILILANDRWKLKATLQAWRKWLHFEFWPAWFFYLPIIPYYVFLSIRYRSLLIPFYANPNVKHGGLIGESKWAFLKFLDSASPATLSATFLNHGLASSEVRAQLNANKICFPMVAKPDVGQRGFAVRILKNEAELFSYLDLSESDVIAQQKSKYTSEAGVFYLRYPSQKQGQIFSITDKKFPFVIGDGQTRLGDLILQDSRARIIAGTYFSRHQDSLDTVIAKDEKYFLSECGNHCQGAIFLNGAHLATTELLSAIEKIAQKIPDFYFGRIDIRYQDENSLKKGLHFEIIEVNGAGSEATHIWDAKTNLIEAYRVLFAQWEHLFAIGAELKKTGKSRKPECLEFILDCIKVYFRKGSLTTSS